MLKSFPVTQWNDRYPDTTQQAAIKSIENGEILYFPKLSFTLQPEELQFLTPDHADPHAKNISFDMKQNRLWGVRNLSDIQHAELKSMLERYSRSAFDLIKGLLPHYASQMTVARTSFRPVQVSDRKTSYRKDDRRLHIDAFPSAPNQGSRILRVFCNINPNEEDRVWRTGEPFINVAQKFLPQISKPIPGHALAMWLLKITKSYRTDYDHYMLKMHNAMKADEVYQKEAPQEEVRFPAGSSWIVQTDDVSHAAMQGQYVLEQTFYLPLKAMKDESKSPLRILEKLLGKKLV